MLIHQHKTSSRNGLPSQSLKIKHAISIPKAHRATVTCDVVIPYDVINVKWLPQSVDSILNQSHADCIIHIIRDGFSVDDDPTTNLWNDLPQVKRYENQVSIGPYLTLHRIFDRLETDFIAVQDSDDISLPNRIWQSIMSLEKSGAEAFGGVMEQFLDFNFRNDPVLKKKLGNTPYHRSGRKSSWSPGGHIINGTLVIRRRTFERLNGFVELPCGADSEFSARIYWAQIPVYFASDLVGLRRMHSESLSHGIKYAMDSPNRVRINKWVRKQAKTYPTHYRSCFGFNPEIYGCLDKYRAGTGTRKI